VILLAGIDWNNITPVVSKSVISQVPITQTAMDDPDQR
jgi:hypothetical protein